MFLQVDKQFFDLGVRGSSMLTSSSLTLDCHGFLQVDKQFFDLGVMSLDKLTISSLTLVSWVPPS